jgi:hypothetical protein
MDFVLIVKRCPNCHQEELGVPVFSTGRLPSQMAQHTAPLAHMLVFREGPIPPDGEYLQELLEAVSPDALATPGLKIRAIPMPS